jgi:hypothetical protein
MPPLRLVPQGTSCRVACGAPRRRRHPASGPGTAWAPGGGILRRASTYRISSPTHWSTVRPAVSSAISGASGASYGAETP